MADTTLPVEKLTTTMPPEKKRGLLKEEILAITGAVAFVIFLVSDSVMPDTTNESIKNLNGLMFMGALGMWLVSIILSVQKVGTKNEKKLKILPEEIAAIIGLIFWVLGALISKFTTSTTFKNKVPVVICMIFAGIICFFVSIVFDVARDAAKQDHD